MEKAFTQGGCQRLKRSILGQWMQLFWDWWNNKKIFHISVKVLPTLRTLSGNLRPLKQTRPDSCSKGWAKSSAWGNICVTVVVTAVVRHPLPSFFQIVPINKVNIKHRLQVVSNYVGGESCLCSFNTKLNRAMNQALDVFLIINWKNQHLHRLQLNISLCPFKMITIISWGVFITCLARHSFMYSRLNMVQNREFRELECC